MVRKKQSKQITRATCTQENDLQRIEHQLVRISEISLQQLSLIQELKSQTAEHEKIIQQLSSELMDNKKELSKKQTGLKKTGMLVALSIGIHNFPEGIATFTSALNSMEIALPITAAIAIHNIPEGIAVSVPIYQATGNKKKAFWLSFLSGMAEPVGALFGFLILLPFWTPAINGFILAAVSGIMVFISIDELLPSAQKYGEHHLSISGLVGGMVIMALSLFLFI